MKTRLILCLTALQRAIASILFFISFSVCLSASPQTPGAVVLPSDAEIRKVVAERVDAIAGKEDGIGIVVGVIGPQGRRIIAYGHPNQGDSRPLDGDTVFEICSVTKVFTALLLTEMVEKGEVGLADPVAKNLGADVKLPERNSRSITLLDLATHTSSLPFMPDDSQASNNSSARYFDANLYRFLVGYKLRHDIGTRWDYSNIGYWLLGQALAARAGASYETLLQTRVVAPLKLKHTAFVLSPEMKMKLAIGHNASLEPTPYIPADSMYGLMPAAGLLYSTVNDLLTFMSVAMGYERSPLAPAISAMLKTRRPMDKRGFEQALGWVVIREGDNQLIFHDGGSLGSASVVVWDPAKRIGVAVLSNHVESVADIGRHLLRPDFALKKPTATKHTEISLDAATLERYSGRYEAAGEGIFEIKLEGDFLTIQAPADWGLPKLRLRPESLRSFFTAELPLRVTFQSDSDGDASGLLIYPPRGQHVVPAKRLNK